jgi:hypothetical protein
MSLSDGLHSVSNRVKGEVIETWLLRTSALSAHLGKRKTKLIWTRGRAKRKTLFPENHLENFTIAALLPFGSSFFFRLQLCCLLASPIISTGPREVNDQFIQKFSAIIFDHRRTPYKCREQPPLFLKISRSKKPAGKNVHSSFFFRFHY